MWKKVQDNNDLEKIKAGLILIKYPLDGDAVDELNLSDKENLSRYEVFSIHPATNLVELRIPEDELPNPSHILGLGQVGGISHNPIVLNKNKSDLVKDGNWWYRS